jgi:ubiquinone biosynthesis accessory factor UbiJ
MRWPDPAAAPARVANRLLANQDWAREKLAPFAGRVFTFAVGPVLGAWLVTAEGTLDTASRDVPADLRLTLSPWNVPAFLADPTRWNEFVKEAGDVEFGGALKDLARTWPWFVEETFAKVLGPIVGQRAADAGRRLLGFPEYAGQRVAESVGSYARDEAGLIARGGEFREWRDEVAAVTARVDALADRVAALAPKVRPIR